MFLNLPSAVNFTLLALTLLDTRSKLSGGNCYSYTEAASLNLGQDIDKAFKIPFQYYLPISYTSNLKQ